MGKEAGGNKARSAVKVLGPILWYLGMNVVVGSPKATRLRGIRLERSVFGNLMVWQGASNVM